MIGNSIRARLVAWHILTVGVLLGAFAGGSWIFMVRTAQVREDKSLAQISREFIDLWDSEQKEHGSSAAAAAASAANEFRFRDRRILVFDQSNRLAAFSDSMPLAADLPVTSLRRLALKGASGQSSFFTIDRGDDEEISVRVHSSAVRVGSELFTVVALGSLRAGKETAENFAQALVVISLLVLVLAGLGGYLLAWASLAPVVAMAHHAERMSVNNLHERLPIANPKDELGRLGGVLNGLLERLEHSFERQQRSAEQQRQFMADASHELRTPVTAICSAADVALSRPDRNPAELLEALAVVGNEGQRLGRVVNDLFLLARADAGQVALRPELLYLEEVIQDCGRAARAIATRKGITLVVPIMNEALFYGDPHLLRRLLMILLDNAIKYTPAGGEVKLSLRKFESVYEISVEDTGPGIPIELRKKIFDRFFRVDMARERVRPGNDYPAAATDIRLEWHADSGAGLGLPIAQWIAASHGGNIRMEPALPAGSRFTVTLASHKPEHSQES